MCRNVCVCGYRLNPQVRLFLEGSKDIDVLEAAMKIKIYSKRVLEAQRKA